MKPGAWILLFAATGFGIAALFATVLAWPRDLLVLAYLLIAGGLMLAFLRDNGPALVDAMRHHWRGGVLVGLGLGALLVATVLMQPASPSPTVLHLLWSLGWLGLVYGLLDGLLLNVLPVLVLNNAAMKTGAWMPARRVAIAFGASMLVTAAYHLGYREFRGPQLSQPLIGNAVLTAGYLLTGNAAAPLIGHVIMHGAAVLHGPETTVQLPPHYSPSGNSPSARSRQPARP